jgi:hypothetical protein
MVVIFRKTFAKKKSGLKRKEGKMEKKVQFIIMLILVCAVFAHATIEDIDIYSDTTIVDGDEYDTVNIYDSLDDPPIQTTVTMTGGSISSCNTHNSTILNYLGGEIDYFVAADNSAISVHSNHSYEFSMIDYGNVFLYNGSSVSQVLIISPDAELHIYGYNLSYNYGPPDLVSGYWKDSNQYFQLSLRIAAGINGQDVVYLHNIPEPATILFFTIGKLLLRRNWA